MDYTTHQSSGNANNPATKLKRSNRAEILLHRDMDTSDWGPYTNVAMGLSHVLGNGHLMNVIPLCGNMSNRRPVPKMTEHSRHFCLIGALPDLSYYSVRYVIEPDESLIADVEYVTINESAAAIVTRYMNKGSLPSNIETQLVFFFEPCLPAAKIRAGRNFHIIPAEKYDRIDQSVSKWVRDLPFGVVPNNLAIGGKVVDFLFYRGRELAWKLPTRARRFPYLMGRYCLAGKAVSAEILIGQTRQQIRLTDTHGEFRFFKPVKLPQHLGDSITMKLSRHNSSLKLDCLVFSNTLQPPEVSQASIPEQVEDLKLDNAGKMIHMKPATLERRYGVWSEDLADRMPLPPHRHFNPLFSKNFDEAISLLNISNMVHDRKTLHARYMAVGGMPRSVRQGDSFTEHFVIVTGLDEIELKKNTTEARRLFDSTLAEKRGQYRLFSKRFRGRFGPFSEALSAQTFVNICYPEFIKDKPVKFYTPAKHYHSLYLWDMGMTGVGLACTSAKNAEELLNQYLSEEGSKLPFIAWGTILPCHIFMYWINFTNGGDREFLQKYFTRCMSMYDFFCGRHPLSVLRDPMTGLINNFCLNYNSGGWDDYPAQMIVAERQTNKIFPVVCLAQTILSAKILRQAANILGNSGMTKRLTADINEMESALYSYHWNQAEGLFSYYDKSKPGFLEFQGEDANKGLDGYYPLVSHSVANDRAKAMIEQLMDPKRFLTDFGLTTVDKTACYFREDGYWNGHVWAPHNWFFWKALLDYGQSAAARKVAMRILGGFARAYEKTHTIYECLHHATGSPEHVPFFSGLTAPLLDIHHAYFGDIGVSSGFQVRAELKKSRGGYRLAVDSSFFTGRTSLILRLGEAGKFSLVKGDREITKFKTDTDGCSEINVNIDCEKADFQIIRQM